MPACHAAVQQQQLMRPGVSNSQNIAIYIIVQLVALWLSADRAATDVTVALKEISKKTDIKAMKIYVCSLTSKSSNLSLPTDKTLYAVFRKWQNDMSEWMTLLL